MKKYVMWVNIKNKWSRIGTRCSVPRETKKGMSRGIIRGRSWLENTSHVFSHYQSLSAAGDLFSLSFIFRNGTGTRLQILNFRSLLSINIFALFLYSCTFWIHKNVCVIQMLALNSNTFAVHLLHIVWILENPIFKLSNN